MGWATWIGIRVGTVYTRSGVKSGLEPPCKQGYCYSIFAYVSSATLQHRGQKHAVLSCVCNHINPPHIFVSSMHIMLHVFCTQSDIIFEYMCKICLHVGANYCVLHMSILYLLLQCIAAIICSFSHSVPPRTTTCTERLKLQ